MTRRRMPRSRLAALAAAGAATAVAVWAIAPDVPPSAEDATPQDDHIRRASANPGLRPPMPIPTGRDAPASAASSPAIDWAALERARMPGHARSAQLFARHSWSPPTPPPPKVVPPPPEPPRAPPFPYSYFGTLHDADGLTAFFAQGSRVLAVRAGEQLGGFRVDAIEGTRATVTYLPLGQTQDIPLSKAP